MSFVYANGTFIPEDELYHYGVLGMKWGVRRAQYKSGKIDRLKKKALDYDVKTAKLTKKAEKIHADRDLERSNKSAKKAANYDKKAAKLEKKALSSDSDFTRTRLEKRSENLKYKAAKNRIKANRLSRATGYGVKAMKYAVKSDIAASKAANARRKLANNQAYIAAMNRKISSLTPEELRGAYSFVNELKNA